MKNPWMSLWLSAANRAAGTARGYWLAEAERQRQALVRQATRSFWPGLPATKRAASRRRPK
ncbi:MAG: hypothetical protein U1E40_05190 [Amaricoccus sp.]